MSPINRDTSQTALFKKCPSCGFEWSAMDLFLIDTAVELIGYQVHFTALTEGIFLFNHNCGTTFGIKAGKFNGLYKGPIFRGSAAGTPDCPGYCLNKEILLTCPSQCECAYVREIIEIIRNWPKPQSGS